MKAPKMGISLNFVLMLISSLVMISDIEIMNKVSAQTLVASTSCASGYYFNSVTLNCQACPTNYLKSSDGLSCYCPRNYIKTGSTKPETCQSCSSGQASNFVQSTCIACDSIEVDSATNCGCNNDKYLQEYLSSSTRKLRCVDCPKGYYSTANGNPLYYCTKCPLEYQTASGGTCSCGSLTAMSTFCVENSAYTTVTLSYNPSSSISVTYDQVYSGTGTSTGTVASSNTFEYLLPQALYECLKYTNSTMCNRLANLCVYQMYKENSAPCLAFKNMQTNITTAQNSFYDSGWKAKIPWLYYAATGNSVIQQSNRVQGKAKFQDSSAISFLNFKMGKYNLEGNFLGFEDLTYQLQLCGADYDYTRDFRNFGTTLYTSCSFDATILINSYLKPNNTDVFYDLYLVDSSGNYIDVPVKINNYVDSSGNYPNKGSNSQNWKLTRRFFVYDTKSGLEGTNAYVNGGYGTYIRWLSKVNIIIELTNDHTDSIYVPYVELEYSSKAKVYIPNSSTTLVSFKASYKMDPSNFWLIALIFFGILNGVVIIMIIVKVFFWITHHPKQLMGSVYPLKLLYKIIIALLESWSSLMFWYLFSLTCAWYFFFKLDLSPYILLPLNEDNNYLAFDVIFGFVIVLKLILIYVKIINQSFCSYYVLDREKNMNSIYSTLTNAINQHKSDERGFYERETTDLDEPKAWRPIFVMNELNELCSANVISIEVILIWTSFLLVGESCSLASRYDTLVLHPHERTLHSYALMYFLFTVIILAVGTTYYILRYVVSFLFSLS